MPRELKAGVREEQREKSRRAILDAATELFSHVGYDGASLGEVSKMSGVSKQNLLYHFDGKEGLWKETVADVFEKVDRAFAEHFGSAAEADDPLLAVAAAYFEVCRQYPAYVRLPMIEGINDTWRSQLIAEKYLKPHVEAFQRRVEALVAEGRLPDIPAIHLQNLVAGGAQLYLALAPIWKHAVGADTTEEAFLEGYRRTIAVFLTSR
jgi:TetR/AcrR family transcriptional regulator